MSEIVCAKDLFGFFGLVGLVDVGDLAKIRPRVANVVSEETHQSRRPAPFRL